MELLATVTIEKYVRMVILADKRRTTYYEKGKKKLPAKYATQLDVNYKWTEIKGKILLTDAYGTPVISNPSVAGTPRAVVIKGNDLWRLNMLEAHKSKITKAIKAQFIPEINKLEPITKGPIRILCEIHDTVIDQMYIDDKTKKAKRMNCDIDNRFLFYGKAFPDVLQGTPMVQLTGEKDSKGKDIKKIVYTSKRIIPDDGRLYITQPPVPLFVPIEDTNNRKLVFKIYHDDREVVQNDPLYRNWKQVLQEEE